MGSITKRSFEVNEKLKSYIEHNDKRPTAIADKAKIRRDTFSRILHGQRPIYADEVRPICQALGISVGYLFGETEVTRSEY